MYSFWNAGPNQGWGAAVREHYYDRRLHVQARTTVLLRAISTRRPPLCVVQLHTSIQGAVVVSSQTKKAQ
jgi:hypothetical protein